MRFLRKLAPRIGGHDVRDARLLADLERGAGATPEGCEWLDDRTVEDLDLGEVFTAVDRTRTATGAQVLWRYLAAPAQSAAVLAKREALIDRFRATELRDRVNRALGTTMIADAPHVARLLWGEPASAFHRLLLPAMWVAMAGCLALAFAFPVSIVGVVLVLAANIVIDDWSKLRLAHQARGLALLDELLTRAAAVAKIVPTEVDLGVRHGLKRRMAVNRIRDPFGLADLVRAATLLQLAVTRSVMRYVTAERERFRRVVVWFGEVDALAAIAALRAGAAALRVPEVVDGPIIAEQLAHPAIEDAIGNDFVLSSGLLITGSNASGKSTFLRTVAVNAILAQSIHTTFGGWRAPLIRVCCVMRIADDPGGGLSTYAVEVAAIGALVTAESSNPLFVIDEPFNGTNPAIRVPIVIAVLEYLVARGLVIAATHDLDVASRLDARFDRCYFDEQAGGFDRRLRAGIAPATNAIELLRRAGYPAAILDRL